MNSSTNTMWTVFLSILILALAGPASAQPPELRPPGARATPVPTPVPTMAPTPTPTPANRTFDCTVEAPGERCTVDIGTEREMPGTVAFYEEVSGKWIKFGSGPFDREGRPGGCGWVLSYRDRLVEERGCFEDGKREGTWETCPMRLGVDGSTTPLSACEETEYRAGTIFVKPKEPEPEEKQEETAAEGEAAGDEESAGAEAEAPAES
jgi:hypothetical protein